MNLPGFVLALLIMLAGLAGTVLPALPGIPLIYLGYLVYGLFSGWQDYGTGTMVLWGVVTAASLALDYYAPMLGARRSSSSILGMWGSFAGAIIGLILFSLPGLLIGTFAGAVIGELMARRSIEEALRAGKGAIVGFLVGSLLKVVVGLIMIGVFIWQVAMRG